MLLDILETKADMYIAKYTSLRHSLNWLPMDIC